MTRPRPSSSVLVRPRPSSFATVALGHGSGRRRRAAPQRPRHAPAAAAETTGSGAMMPSRRAVRSRSREQPTWQLSDQPAIPGQNHARTQPHPHPDAAGRAAEPSSRAPAAARSQSEEQQIIRFAAVRPAKQPAGALCRRQRLVLQRHSPPRRREPSHQAPTGSSCLALPSLALPNGGWMREGKPTPVFKRPPSAPNTGSRPSTTAASPADDRTKPLSTDKQTNIRPYHLESLIMAGDCGCSTSGSCDCGSGCTCANCPLCLALVRPGLKRGRSGMGIGEEHPG
ncbi:hypothetical protein TCAP_04932 [Tolypocladium capitatum]|uniref:Uncharacterized protein n=1 Tax=Tolypocladium capitatum TaxID=45235 RepID=A0A2K3QC55_9HYPO|nr:hypothetical protein TCAP_04932 [Tolypocladium capitatum]